MAKGRGKVICVSVAYIILGASMAFCGAFQIILHLRYLWLDSVYAGVWVGMWVSKYQYMVYLYLIAAENARSLPLKLINELSREKKGSSLEYWILIAIKSSNVLSFHLLAEEKFTSEMLHLTSEISTPIFGIKQWKLGFKYTFGVSWMFNTINACALTKENVQIVNTVII